MELENGNDDQNTLADFLFSYKYSKHSCSGCECARVCVYV